MYHKIPQLPLECVGTDLFMWNSKQYLIIVDYYSRFFEFENLHTLTGQTLINKLMNIFARHGIPQTLISDNGPQFLSELFTNFAKTYAFTHKTPSPHHPNQMDLLKKLLGLANVCLLKKGKVKVIFHLVCWNIGTPQFVVQLHQPRFLWVEVCAQFYQ